MPTSPNQFKYRYFYEGDTLFGNSIDSVANSLVKVSGGKYSFAAAVVEVSKNMIPVHKSIVEQSFPKKAKSDGLSFQEVVAGATSAMKQLGGVCEKQEVINRRAIACSACPKKTEVKICGPCGQLAKVTKALNGLKKLFGFGHTIPNDLDKSYCNVCNCSLSLMLPAQLVDFKEKTVSDPERPKTCWIVKESKK